jgi:hypothetical protein
MTSTINSKDENVATLCAALEKEPLFHMSLGSKELFHSNFLAWFADSFPEQAADVFRPWTVPMVGVPAGPSEREPAHLDLVLHLPGLAPIAVENKVFSVPGEEQLDRYTDGVLARREADRTSYAHVLLSLISPGWTTYKTWQLLSYRELAEALRSQVAHIKAVNAFAGDLLEHYVGLINRLADLLDLLGTPAPDEPLLLSSTVASYLDRARVSAGVQKARASWVVRELCRAIAAKGWPDIRVNYGFTKGTSLIEGFCRQEAAGSDPTGDGIGWQFQDTQFRLAVFTGTLHGSAQREAREAYVAQRYAEWFKFGPLEAIIGDMEKMRINKFRGGRWGFQGYNPNFVYRYRIAPELTPSQIIELGMLYLDRARQMLTTNG